MKVCDSHHAMPDTARFAAGRIGQDKEKISQIVQNGSMV
jgi:hypothetical protein